MLFFLLNMHNAIEDDCEGDFDGDGVSDETDVCPRKYLVKTTNFNKNFEVIVGNRIPGETPLLLVQNVRQWEFKSEHHIFRVFYFTYSFNSF